MKLDKGLGTHLLAELRMLLQQLKVSDCHMMELDVQKPAHRQVPVVV